MARLSKAKQRQYKKEFQRERRRINDYIKRKLKQGYEVGYEQIGRTPTYVTKKDVDRLKKITREKLVQKTFYYRTDEDTGETEEFRGKQASLVKRREDLKYRAREETFEERLERMKRHAEGNESMYKFERDPNAPKMFVDEETGEVTVEDQPGTYELDTEDNVEWESSTSTVAEDTKKYTTEDVDDYMLIGEAIEDMISNFVPSAAFDSRTAQKVAELNIDLMIELENAISKLGKEAVYKNIAQNYEELVTIIDHVQNYVNVAGEITRFSRLLTGHTLTLAENIAYTETYNDSDTLTPYEIEDYYS